jgi:hypothetical protein
MAIAAERQRLLVVDRTADAILRPDVEGIHIAQRLRSSGNAQGKKNG